jgi:hypothetical protein
VVVQDIAVGTRIVEVVVFVTKTIRARVVSVVILVVVVVLVETYVPDVAVCPRTIIGEYGARINAKMLTNMRTEQQNLSPFVNFVYSY